MRFKITASVMLVLALGYNVLAEDEKPAPAPKPEPEAKKSVEEVKKDLDALKKKVEKLEKKVADKISDKSLEKLAKLWQDPAAGYAAFGVKTTALGTPSVLSARLGAGVGGVLHSDGNIAFVGTTTGGSAVLLCPTGSAGFGSPTPNWTAVYYPYNGDPYWVKPEASATYPGSWEYRVADPNSAGFMLVQ